MSHTNIGRIALNVAPRAIASLALIFAMSLAARAQHGGHDMRNMPGMNARKPKAKPRAKRRTKRGVETAARRKNVARRAPVKSDMKGMDMNMPVPPQSQPPTPAASPSKAAMENMPGMTMPAAPATPAASPSPRKPAMSDMPGMPMPSASPTTAPQASPSPEHRTDVPMNMPMNMPMNNTNPQASPSPGVGPEHSGGAGHDSMPGMKTEGGMTDMSESDVNELMVMSGDEMGVRVGRSKSNVMPMGRMGSGTAWQPAASPMNMIHRRAGDWLLMFHYDAKIGVNHQGGPRGATSFESSNWFMPMAYHRLGAGTLQLRGMFSAEPFTFPRSGSPLLFQTGETYKGRPLIDRQHPHDLFMELSAQYTLPLGERATWYAYAGYPGEPALGPVAFMHRASASENPSAALAHHLQDSTHISFGVVTTGFTYRWLKLEGSLFNGREPDENRYDFDAHKWNSRSARLSFAPNRNWAMQISYGFLRSPEAQEPSADIRRATASAQYVRPFKRGDWASSFVWGRNHVSEPGATRNLNGYTFESTINFLDKNYLYTRLELVDRDELLRESDRALLRIASAHPVFRVGAYTFGYVRDVFDDEDWSIGLGGDVTTYSKPDALDAIYGARPVSFKLFLRVRPGRAKADHDMTGGHSTHGDVGMKH